MICISGWDYCYYWCVLLSLWMQLIKILLKHANKVVSAGNLSRFISHRSWVYLFIIYLRFMLYYALRRCRKVEPDKTPYQLLIDTFVYNESSVNAELFNKDTGAVLVLQLTALKDNIFRIHINEKNPVHPRYEPEHVLQNQPQTTKLTLVEKTKDNVVLRNGENKVILYANPFRADLYSQDVLVVSANARGLMRFEHHRAKPKYVP